MTQEQKAKAYDEALERAKDVLETDIHESGVWAIKKIFPELFESKDEKIRKELLAVINDLVLPDEQKARFNAWFEKQKEQKPDELTPEEKMNHPLWLEGFDVGRAVQRVFEEPKPAEFDEYKIIKKHITEDMLSSEVNKRLTECGWYVTDKKPAEWSEEDEHRCKDAIYFLETAKKHYADTSEIELTIDWLKSLKERITINDKNYDETRTEKRN